MQGLRFFETVRKEKADGTFEEIKVLRFDKTDEISAVGIKDESLIVTSAEYGCIRMWNPLTGGTLVFVPPPIEIEGVPSSEIESVTWKTPVYKKQKGIVVADLDVFNEKFNIERWYLQIWDSNTTECLKTIVSKNTIRAFDITPDGTRIVIVSDDSIEILDINTGKCLNTVTSADVMLLRQLPKNFSSIVMNLTHDSQKLITRGEEKLVLVWNLANLKCQRIFRGHENIIRSLESSYDSSRVVSADISCMIIWDTITGERLRVISAYNAMSIKFNFDGTHVVFNEHLRNGFGEVFVLDIAKTEDHGIANHVAIANLSQSSPITAVDFCYGGNFWNRRIQYLHCGFLRDTHHTVIAASTKNPDLPFLPSEIWEHIFEFIPIQNSIITASWDGTATIIHL
jgi:WD40 repeat protein